MLLVEMDCLSGGCQAQAHLSNDDNITVVFTPIMQFIYSH